MSRSNISGVRLVVLGQGQTVGVDPWMVFDDDSPITVNYVGFTSVIVSNADWLVPDEFISGPGTLKFTSIHWVTLSFVNTEV